VHGHNLLVIEKATGRFPALRENPRSRRKNPPKRKKMERTAYLAKRQGRKRYKARIRSKNYRPRRKSNPSWFIHIQRARGPVMLWNGRSFSNDSASGWAVPFSSSGAAMQKARWLLGKYHEKLRTYKVWVSDKIFGEMQEPRRVNPAARAAGPESLDAAAKKLEDFTGIEATHVERVQSRSSQKTGWVLGELDLLGYRARRQGIAGGREARYSHHFRKGSRPLLATSTDGKQLHIVGGRYEVTEAGVEDR
jgi:hypothetical protein